MSSDTVGPNDYTRMYSDTGPCKQDKEEGEEYGQYMAIDTLTMDSYLNDNNSQTTERNNYFATTAKGNYDNNLEGGRIWFLFLFEQTELDEVFHHSLV